MENLEDVIRSKLQQAFQPTRLEVRNVSHQHAGHASSPGTGQSHFEVEIICPAFQGINKVSRHRQVYQALQAEMAGPIHALKLTALSPEESP